MAAKKKTKKKVKKAAPKRKAVKKKAAKKAAPKRKAKKKAAKRKKGLAGAAIASVPRTLGAVFHACRRKVYPQPKLPTECAQ